MPVLVSGVTVLVRCAALAERWGGGVEGFADAYGRRRTCQDGRLAAVLLEDEDLALGVLRDLQEAGIRMFARRDGEGPCDAAVVSEWRGPASWWPWLELAAVTLPGGRRVLAAREAGSDGTGVVLPER